MDPSSPEVLLVVATALAAIAALMSATAAKRSADAAERTAEASERLAGPVVRLVPFGGPQVVGDEVVGPDEFLLAAMNRGNKEGRISTIQILRMGFSRCEDQLVFADKGDPIVIPAGEQRALLRTDRLEDGKISFLFAATMHDLEGSIEGVARPRIEPILKLYYGILRALGRFEKTEHAMPIIGRPFEGERGGKVLPPDVPRWPG